MEVDSGLRIRQIKVDGGGSRNEFMMQFQADMLGIPVVTSQTAEATSMGAAFAAGLAVGFWDGEANLKGIANEGRGYRPEMSQGEREQLCEGWRRAVDCALKWGEPARRNEQ
jgi:glycerol kinase